MYDVTIVGAGPAGATLARLIGQKYKVLLADKRNLYDADYNLADIKCCGGLLAPDAQKMMARLGLGLPENVLAGPQLFAVRAIDLHTKRERFYQRFYINIDRLKFDRWLVSLIPDNVELTCAVFKSFTDTGNGLQVTLLENGREKLIQTKYLIGADGAASTVRRQALGRERLPKRYTAIQEWFYAGDVSPYFSSIFDAEITDFYSWTIPKGDKLIVGAAIPAGINSRKKFLQLKDKLADIGFDLSTPAATESAMILRPVSPMQLSAGKRRVALIGEAGGWISPSSAEGLSYAFRSALALAEVILDNGLDLPVVTNYNRRLVKLKINLLVKSLKSPFMYNSFLRNIIMSSGLQSVSIK